MKRILFFVMSTNLIYAAAPRASVSCADELEAVKKELEKAYRIIQDGYASLRTVDSEILTGKLATPRDVSKSFEGLSQSLREGGKNIYNSAWTPAEIESQKAWNTIQKHMSTYILSASGAAQHPNIWDVWGEQEWKQKEDIIGQKAGQGTIWKINKELGDFLTIYMQDYTDIRTQDRGEFVHLVGNVVPSLFGHGISLSKQTLKETLEKITKLAPKTGKVLQEKFSQRVGGALAPAAVPTRPAAPSVGAGQGAGARPPVRAGFPAAPAITPQVRQELDRLKKFFEESLQQKTDWDAISRLPENEIYPAIFRQVEGNIVRPRSIAMAELSNLFRSNNLPIDAKILEDFRNSVKEADRLYEFALVRPAEKIIPENESIASGSDRKPLGRGQKTLAASTIAAQKALDLIKTLK